MNICWHKNSASILILVFIAFMGVSFRLYASPTTADYSMLPSIQTMRISPSGDTIAYRQKSDGVDLLRIYSLRNKKPIRSLDLSSIDPGNMFFINNEQLIFKGSQEMKIGGFKGRVQVSTAFALDIRSGDIRQLLIPGKGIYRGQSGLGKIVGVSHDGKYAYMPAFYSKNKHSNTPPYALMEVSLTKNSATPRVKDLGRGDAVDYFVDNSNNVLARERYSEKNNIHRVDARVGKEWVNIFTQETSIVDFGFAGVTPNGKSLVVIEEDEKSDSTRLYTMSLKDGSMSDSIFSRDDADIETTITDINRVLYGVRYSGFQPSYKFFDESLDKRVSNIVGAFPEDSVLIVDQSPDWKYIVIKLTGATSLGDYYLFTEGKESPQFLGSERPNFELGDIHPIGRVTYKARDGLKIPTLLTIPRDKVATMKNLPAIMLPHGGPEGHDTVGFNWLAQSFANQGYLVIQPQFRGSDGFGFSHILAGRGEWGKKMQDDLTDGINFLAKKGIIDKDRVCIFGWSYGGYAALAGAAFTPDLYQCAVSVNGVSDLHKFIRTEKREHGSDSQILTYWESVTAQGKASRNELLKISPAGNADKIKIPVLLLHSNKDRSVNINQSKVMALHMKKSNKDVKMITLKGDGHQILLQENRTKMLDESIKFINAHIGNKQ